MRLIEIDHYGPAANLLLRTQDQVPAPLEGQVQVRVKAASYNPVDTALREGALDPISARSFPQGQGLDWSGVVQAVGVGVTDWKVGDELIGCQPAAETGIDGSWAEVMTSNVECVGPKPTNANWEEAAGLPLVGLTALQALRDHGGLGANRGMKVLVNGASGGVGHLAIQLAKILGAIHVVGTAGSEHLDFVRGLGADEAVDYESIDSSKYEGMFDIYFDAAAKVDFTEIRSMLTENGTYIRTRPSAKTVAEAALTKVAGIVGYEKQAKVIWMKPKAADLRMLSELTDSGQLKVVVAEIFPFVDYVRFVQAGEKSEAPGKYVLSIS